MGSIRMESRVAHVTEVDKGLWVWVVTDNNYGVIGKATMKVRNHNIVRLQDAWVHESFRGQGIYRLLFEARMDFINEWYKDYTIQSYCRPITRDVLLKDGFECTETLYIMQKNHK